MIGKPTTCRYCKAYLFKERRLVAQVIKRVSKITGVSPAIIRGESRQQRHAYARQIVAAVCALRGLSEPRIGSLLKRTPATIHHAKVQAKKNHELRWIVNLLMEKRYVKRTDSPCFPLEPGKKRGPKPKPKAIKPRKPKVNPFIKAGLCVKCGIKDLKGLCYVAGCPKGGRYDMVRAMGNVSSNGSAGNASVAQR